MSDTARPPAYRAEAHHLESARDGTPLRLEVITPAGARLLGHGLANIDPWARVGYDPERMMAFLAAVETGATRYQIMADGLPAGVLVMRNPWLHGPYLHLFGLLPQYQRRGIGDVALRWIEAEARGRYRNLWLCVSSFNEGARRLYERHGYTLAGRLDGLVYDGLDELLMRKLLVP